VGLLARDVARRSTRPFIAVRSAGLLGIRFDFLLSWILLSDFL
jgi:hypothetical protein